MSEIKTNAPETSVVTPSYNRAHLLPDLIESLKKQTYQDFEIIIVDDGSTDNTKEVMQSIVDASDGKVHYFYQENAGSGKARNTGINNARGKYVAFLDSDDTWLPTYLERTIGLLNRGRHHWSVCAAKKVDIDKQGNQIGESIRKADIQRDAEFFGRELSLYEALLAGNVVGETSRIVSRKSALQAVGGFDDSLRLSQDYELWIRMARENYVLAVIDEPLVVYTKSTDSVTKTRYVEALKYGYRITKRYRADGIRRDNMFRKWYADKFLKHARESIRYSQKDFILCARCVFRSIYYTLGYHIVNAVQGSSSSGEDKVGKQSS